MMDKKALVEKIGVLLEGLQESYQRISEGTEQLNPLEIELFEVNSIYFSEHTKILTKLEEEAAAASGQEQADSTEQENNQEEPDEVAAEVENPDIEETMFTPQTKTDDVESEPGDEQDEPDKEESVDAQAEDAEDGNEREDQSQQEETVEAEQDQEVEDQAEAQQEPEDEGSEGADDMSAESEEQVEEQAEEPAAEQPSAETESAVSADAETQADTQEQADTKAEEDNTAEHADTASNNEQEETEVDDGASDEVEERELPMEEADHKDAEVENEKHTFRFNFTPEEPEKQESFRNPESGLEESTPSDQPQEVDFKGPEAQSQEIHIAPKEVSISEPEPSEEPKEEPVSPEQSAQQNGASSAPVGFNSLQQQASKERPMSLNERISAQRREQQGQSRVGGQVKPELKRIKDIKSAISLNDKLLFIKDLFNGYSLAYSEAMELLNRCGNFQEADQFLQDNYAAKNNWGTKKETVSKLYDILKKRYGTYG